MSHEEPPPARGAMTDHCPHGANSDPARCSQCIGAPARVVRSDEHGVTVDGVKVRGALEGWRPDAQARDRHAERKQRARKAARHHAPVATVAPVVVEVAQDAQEAGPPESPLEHIAAADADDGKESPEPAEDGSHWRVVTARPRSSIITSRHLEAAKTIVSYGETHAPLIFPTPADSEAIALLDVATDMCGTDEEIAELHRRGLISLVQIGDPPGLERSLRLRGHRRDVASCVMVDGVAHDGVRVIAKAALIDDALEYAELVWMAHSAPMDAFVSKAWDLAKGDGTSAEGARVFICREWDRIRGVLPPLAPGDVVSEPGQQGVMIVAPLLKRICATIATPPQGGPGRPRLPVSDVVFALVMMAGMQASGRAAARELAVLQERGFLGTRVSASSLWTAMQNPDVSRDLAKILEESASMAGSGTAIMETGSKARIPQARAAEQMAAAIFQNLMQVAQAESVA